MKRHQDFFEPRTCNTICDLSGEKIKAAEARRMWNGFYRKAEYWNERQPQDFAPRIEPPHVVRNARPPKEETSTATPFDPI